MLGEVAGLCVMDRLMEKGFPFNELSVFLFICSSYLCPKSNSNPFRKKISVKVRFGDADYPKRINSV